MQTRKIGSLEVSVVGLGTNNFGTRLDQDGTDVVIDAILDNGINFIDTADTYGKGKSEEFIGNALGSRRSDVVLATKFGKPYDDAHLGGASPDYVRRCLEDSLRRLQTDWVDLYILHAPDPETPISDTLEVLNELVRAGKVREIGCSNFSVEQLVEAEDAAAQGSARFVNLQNRFNVIEREPEQGTLERCESFGVGFVPFSPLAGGLLTGKYHPGEPAPAGTRIAGYPEEQRNQVMNKQVLDKIEDLRHFCDQRSHSLLELCFSWLLTHRSVSSVIAGASTREQVEQNAAAVNWALNADDLEEINQLVPID